jgi:hypothetical protein
MSEVVGKTSAEIDLLLDESIVSGRMESGNLILTTRGGADVLAGYIGSGGGGGGTPVDPGPGPDALTYENAAPNQLFVIYRDSLTGDWPALRPSDRTDIYFEATGVSPPPAWLITGKDRHGIPIGEGGVEIMPEDLLSESGGGGFGGEPQTYETVLPTSIFVIYKDPVTGWPTSRPSARTDITFELVGADPSPGWMLDRDRRGIPKP